MFKTQAELLRHLGKNENDRSLVQRMVIRGEILKENGGYILTNKEEKIKELEEEIKKLRSEIATMHDTMQTMKASNWDLSEAKAQREYWESKAREYAQYCSDIIDVCYKKVKLVARGSFLETQEEFKEWIQRLVKGEGD